MAYVREQYGVPAKRGMRVKVFGASGFQMGTVTRATHYVFIRLDGSKHSRPYHPTDPGITYATLLPPEDSTDGK